VSVRTGAEVRLAAQVGLLLGRLLPASILTPLLISLGAHLGSWEAAAAELARRGRPPTVIAARDGLVAWALRHGAAVWVPEGEADGVRLHVLAPAEQATRPGQARVHALADRAVALLHSAVRRRPETWARVRPLAVVALTVGLTACGPLPEPLPRTVDAWDADVVDLAWDGELSDGAVVGPARFFAQTATVRWVDGAPEGTFVRVEITAPRADGEPSDVRIEAASGSGRWPQGPLELQDVSWEAAGAVGGRIERLRRRAGSETPWDCGGCELEVLLAGAR
jgi:hypothetical protein